MESDALKPCPFCGGEAGYDSSDTGPHCWYECLDCGAKTSSVRDEKIARSAWNLRPTTPDLAAPREERDRLREALGQVRDAIEHADPDVLKCTLWMTGARSETVVDFISAALALKEPPNA